MVGIAQYSQGYSKRPGHSRALPPGLHHYPRYLTAQAGSEVWVAGNVSRRLSALVMIIKAWGVVPQEEERKRM